MTEYTDEPDLHSNVIEPLDFFGPDDVSEKLASVIKAVEKLYHIDNEVLPQLKEICRQIKKLEERALAIRTAEKISHVDKNVIPPLKEISQQINECKSRVYEWKAGDPGLTSIQATQDSAFLAVTDLFDLRESIVLDPDYLEDSIYDWEMVRGTGANDSWNVGSFRRVHKQLATAREIMSLKRIKGKSERENQR